MTTWLHVPSSYELLLEIPIFATIQPLARPRMMHNRRHVYQPKANQVPLLSELASYVLETPLAIPVFVEMLINHQAPPESREPHPHPTAKSHGDLDNQVKAIGDGLVAQGILADDRYIVGISATRAYGPEDLTLIRIWSLSPQPELHKWDSTTATTRLKRRDPAAPTLPLNYPR